MRPEKRFAKSIGSLALRNRLLRDRLHAHESIFHPVIKFAKEKMPRVFRLYLFPFDLLALQVVGGLPREKIHKAELALALPMWHAAVGEASRGLSVLMKIYVPTILIAQITRGKIQLFRPCSVMTWNLSSFGTLIKSIIA